MTETEESAHDYSYGDDSGRVEHVVRKARGTLLLNQAIEGEAGVRSAGV
ncbi:MAG: hypothetical protein JWO87_2032 [Phycisphaerales bacterium]|nr:hypothetical protein [Phycisphaerales bacterium]